MPPAWWQPWTFGGYNIEEPSLNAWELINWYLPRMAPYEQSQMAQALYELGGQQVLPANLSGYNLPAGAPSTTTNWLSGLSSGPEVPSWFTDSPEGNWLANLTKSAANLSPGMTRMEQRTWRSGFEDAMSRAPNSEMKALGTSLYNPFLLAPEYGQAAPLGTYAMPYSTKGGLVGNPWFV